MTTRDDRLSLIDHLAKWITWPRFIFAITLTFFLTSILFPFYWMVSSSFKTYAEIGARNTVYIPGALRLDAYQELFDYWNFDVNILNSIKIAVPTSIIAVILSTLGAYAVARLRFRGKDLLLNSILLIYLFPGILLIIPLFAMVSQIGARIGFDVQDNLPVLVLTYLAQTLPVALYMLANYFRTIPSEIEQAKGAVMAVLRSDAGTSFDTLTRASQHFNVRLRQLSIALVEHIGGAPAEVPEGVSADQLPSERDRRVAAEVWAALVLPSTSPRRGDRPHRR